MSYVKPLFNLWISYDWHKDFWRMLFTYMQQFSEKLMYSTKRTEGSFCGENTAPGL